MARYEERSSRSRNDAWRRVDEGRGNRHFGHENKDDREFTGYYGDANSRQNLDSNRFGSGRPVHHQDNRNLDTDDNFINSSYSSGLDTNIGRQESWGSGSNNTRTDLSSYGYGQNRGLNRNIDHSGKGPKGWKRSDAQIREEVCEALTEDREVDASEIEVRVEDGVVFLSGNVFNRRTKSLAEECVEHISGVQDVQNQLRIL